MAMSASSSCGAPHLTVSILMIKPKQSGVIKGHHFPSEIIAYAVWAYHRFPLSLPNVKYLVLSPIF
jgi:putative transposase